MTGPRRAKSNDTSADTTQYKSEILIKRKKKHQKPIAFERKFNHPNEKE